METRIIAVEKAVVAVYIIDGGIFKKTVGVKNFGDEVYGYQSGSGFVLSGASYSDSKPPYAVRYNETAPLDPPVLPPVAGLILAAGSQFIIKNGDSALYETTQDTPLKAVVQ